MNLNLVARIRPAAVVASALLIGGTGLVLGQQPKDAPAPSKGETPKAERVAGVIVKVEKVAKGGKADSKAGKAGIEGKEDLVLIRLSVNTDAVWRDWARDQAQARDEGTPKQDAARGANSVATKGQPADVDSLVVIDVLASTRVETRFRSPTDETSKGVTTPEKVKSDEGTTSSVTPAKKPVQFRVEDLLPGLFVEAESRPSGPRDGSAASTVSVIRPIKVLDSTPAAKPSPK